MAVIDTTRNSVAPTGVFAAVFATVYTTFANWKAERATRTALSQLSDRELDDIGVVRADIETLARTI